jgi:DNA mismatch repair protein MutL
MSESTSTPRIHKLPNSVANQIAAGEVIERPASVVKELIENSIDASASKIHIDLEEAGVSLIRVRDDGQGIHKDDLELALQAHATSKLSTFSDLSQIVSMGFRGEAIPSIASVSRFKMTSRQTGTEQAWSIDNECQIKPAAHEIGTTVEVNDLFFSTPGRRKFLKSEKTEYLHIQSLIRAISLSHFSTGIFVRHNEQSLFSLPACKSDVEQRVLSICGRSFIKKSVQVDSEKDGLRLWGWLGLNEVARSQSDRQYFYVNGRIVRDKHVSHALRLAYSDRIATGRYPSYVLHLEIDPALVDVNVHPAKSEVRFSETRNVHDFIYSSLMECFRKPIISIDKDIIYETNAIDAQKSINEEFNAYNATNFKQTDMLASRKPATKYLSLFASQFLIVTLDNDQYLIDIAKSRILITAQELLKDFLSKTMIRRPILVPVSCELKQFKVELVLKQKTIIEQWGFELEEVHSTQILIRSIPARLIYSEIILLVNDLLDALYENKADDAIANELAQHVNDSGTALDDENRVQLMNEIIKIENASHESTSFPWRKLDPETLSSLLKTQS